MYRNILVYIYNNKICCDQQLIEIRKMKKFAMGEYYMEACKADFSRNM